MTMDNTQSDFGKFLDRNIKYVEIKKDLMPRLN